MKKFRLWCKNKNEWEKDLWCVLPSGDIFDIVRKTYMKEDTHHLMEYWSVSDKNNKQICEGDIVLCWKKYCYCTPLEETTETDMMREGYSLAVITKTGYDEIITDCPNDWFFYSPDGCNFLGFGDNETIEIIGNIYETKWLLEDL